MSQNIVSASNANKGLKDTLEAFLQKHVITKNEKKQITHTEFGKYSKRSFHIPKEDEEEFENLYYQDIILTKKNHHIIERQVIKDEPAAGPFLIDIDLRLSADKTERVYTLEEHVLPFINEYLAEVSRVFEMDEDTRILVFVQEKPAPRSVVKDSATIVHDGFHLLIGLAVDQVYHEWMRKHMMDVLPHIWGNMPIQNTWDDVFDRSIPSGSNGWLKYRSKKAEDISFYKVTHALEYWYDFDSSSWDSEDILAKYSNEDAFLADYYKQLSARYRKFPTLLCRPSLLPQINALRCPSPTHSTGTAIPSLTTPSCINPTFNALGDEDTTRFRIPIETLRQIRSKEELDICVNAFLENLSPTEYELRETYEFTMTLPDSYYGEGSYNKWVRVGFALKNVSSRLLIVFLAFSAQAKGFHYATQINEVIDKWDKFDMKQMNALNGGYTIVTKKSIMYWSKNDASEQYDKIREKTIDYYLDQTIDSITIESLNNPRKKNARGSTDYDIAMVLYHLCGDEFVSVSIRGNEWYQFTKHRWVKNDSGTTLRNMISTRLRDLYNNKSRDLMNRSQTKDPESEEYKLLYGRAMKIQDIVFCLGSTKDKDNIMKEAREIFYNPEFLDKLDQNKYLLCFKNGVIDFKNKQFRKGYPDDYISKCTDSDYIPLNPTLHRNLMTEIEIYMQQLFPEPELCQYVWDHLASCLIGDTALNQCLHYYTGIGQNGKSMLVKLMQLILGSYSGELDVGFYTQERAKRGQSTPELFAIIGVRYAITSEPSEGDKMNEGPMKQLTSGTDPMSCRAPYGQLMKFVPQANAIIMANHFLEIKSRDHGTWRRVRVVEFKSLFTDHPVKNDPDKPYQFKKVDNLDIKFDEWKHVFMAMLVERAFKTNGIVKVCDLVSASSNQYRKNQDFLAEFIAERIVRDPNGKIKKTELCFEFNEWYRNNYGTRVNKIKELHECMNKQFGSSKENIWVGVRFVYSSEDAITGKESVAGTDIEDDVEEYESI